MDIKEVDKSMEESVSRRMIIDKLEEAYNDVLIWEDNDDWSRGIKEGIYIAMTVINALPSAQPDRSLLFRIGEICVDESKWDITAEDAVEKIRVLLRAERRENG